MNFDSSVSDGSAAEPELTGEAMELTGDGLVIITYTAEPDSPAVEALRFLSSWAQDRHASTAAPD
ncbi:hypothetical protein [Kribbella albertanoniae]|uniref:hypothetical protein n=1 Tax=Kribbella albertanoniae TaxID=1266829 RepID=UPI00140560ED|nr:hypothetical protein [Kribbella albertanoniae]